MRPKTIVYFERIIFGTLLLGPLQSYLSWDRIVQPATSLDHTRILTIIIFSFVLFGTLILLVSRRRRKIAMWVSIALFALGLPSLVQITIRGELLGSHIIAVLQGIGQGVAYGLLFTPSARRWVNREDKKLRDVFH